MLRRRKERSRSRRISGTRAILSGLPWLTPKTLNGGIAPSLRKGRAEVIALLERKWNRELDYRLRKELWGFRENRMAVTFFYEWRDDSGQWYRSYGNELWEFAPSGLMARRLASINDAPIREEERRLRP